MVFVYLMNHLGNRVDRVEYPRIGIRMIYFIANNPKQQGRMILVFQDLALRVGQLSGDCLLVVVIKAVALSLDIQTQGDCHTLLGSFVEQLPTI